MYENKNGAREEYTLRRVVGVLAGFSLLVLQSVFEQLMSLLTDNDEKTLSIK